LPVAASYIYKSIAKVRVWDCDGSHRKVPGLNCGNFIPIYNVSLATALEGTKETSRLKVNDLTPGPSKNKGVRNRKSYFLPVYMWSPKKHKLKN